MKKRISGFVSGFLCACLFLGLTATAVAASHGFNIEVYPINIKVNGEVFQPIDANGNAVRVFTYNGTTYAPLRALAEAYGLQVGYDSSSNLATVIDPSKQQHISEGGDKNTLKDIDKYNVLDPSGVQISNNEITKVDETIVTVNNNQLKNNVLPCEFWYVNSYYYSPKMFCEALELEYNVDDIINLYDELKSFGSGSYYHYITLDGELYASYMLLTSFFYKNYNIVDILMTPSKEVTDFMVRF